MARRKTKARRRRSPKTFSLYDAAVSYLNLSILTEGIMGTSPPGVITGATDLGYTTVTDSRLGAASQVVTGAGAISLGDILNQPALAAQTMMSNAQANMVPMAISAITLNAGAKIFRKVMRQPFNRANRLIKPLALGVRL